MLRELNSPSDITGDCVACHGCDLLIGVPRLDEGERAQCPRCGSILSARHKDAFNRILSFSLSAFVFLVLANLFPFLTLDVQGQQRVISLLQSIRLVGEQGEPLLAVIIFLGVVVFPALFLLGIFYILTAIRQGFMTPINLAVLRIILIVNPWAMGEIFIIGVLISLIKLVSLADVTLGLSFWGYVLFSLFMTATLLHFDKVQIWHWVERSGRRS
jgi:paraquat-inducible protein A